MQDGNHSSAGHCGLPGAELLSIEGEQEVTVFQAARVDDHLWIRDVPIL
jgi:hypothetical protein